MDKGEFSFSTCWNIKKHSNGRDMIKEIKQMGFSRVELNYNVTKEMLASIRPMVENGDIQISSVHNVFPFIDDKDYDTDSVMLGFSETEKREKAVKLLIESVEYAEELGAKGVVVHPGEVPFSYNIDSKLKQLYHSVGKDSAEYQGLWNQMLEKRQLEAVGYVKRIEQSLEEVAEYIAHKQYDVGIGIETRSRCYQIPSLHEANQIITNLAGAPIYLWYDIGHAMMMERMGLYHCLDQMDKLKDKILGVHIHETVELSDHWCPYIHSNDQHYFDQFLEIIDAAQIKVYELKAKCTPDEINQSHALLENKLKQVTF